MQQTEIKVIEKYRREGYVVIENGFPDLTIFKINDGTICDLKFIEVKQHKTYSRNDYLKVNQILLGYLFNELGLEYIIEYVDGKNYFVIKKLPTENIDFWWALNKHIKYPKHMSILNLISGKKYSNRGWIPITGEKKNGYNYNL